MDFPTRPVGDPAAIRNAAEQVRQKASALFDVQYAVGGSVTGMRFQGPAAGRIRGDAVAWRSQANASMRELEALANDLDTAANRLEVDLEHYKRAFAHAQRAEDERRREAQRRHL